MKHFAMFMRLRVNFGLDKRSKDSLFQLTHICYHTPRNLIHGPVFVQFKSINFNIVLRLSVYVKPRFATQSTDLLWIPSNFEILNEVNADNNALHIDGYDIKMRDV